jgi:ethanolamine utilization protein EutN
MEVGKVIGTVIATVKHELYQGKRLLVVQQLSLDGKPQGSPRIAIDYVGAGVGDLVLIGGAPGVAASVFGVEKAPIKDLIMGIIDRVDIGSQRVMTLYDDVSTKER